METRSFLTWAQLRDNYIGAGIPIEQPVLAEPELRLVFDTRPDRLGVRLRGTPPPDWRPTSLQNIVVRKVHLEGQTYVEALADRPDLFRSIYALIGDILSRVSDGQKNLLTALDESLADFEALVERSTEMSKEKAVGLYGELLVLERLLAVDSDALRLWIGSKRETHDFRGFAKELEVKTTSANTRQHVVHGLNQLTPSPGFELKLISVRIGTSGSAEARSLNDLVASLTSRFSGESSNQFGAALRELDYSEPDIECNVGYQLAAPIMAIKIGVEFPEMSYEWLSNVLEREAAPRVRRMDALIDFEGLGEEFDAEEWLK